MIAIAGEVVQQGEKGVNDQGGSGHDIDEWQTGSYKKQYRQSESLFEAIGQKGSMGWKVGWDKKKTEENIYTIYIYSMPPC
jgi:hypothetical protein